MVDKKRLVDKYLELGHLCHRKYLDKEEDREEFINISNEIVELEKELYTENSKLPPKEEEMICPSCDLNYDDESIFCANCGFNIREFYDNESICEICDTVIPKADKYCKVCGGLQYGEDLND
ncbi:MAG: zinc ribbon domain-containing protein [Tissierellia bacterium]|nr:zinc ribbon domain-containing protein [Tissierellia bacterium]